MKLKLKNILIDKNGKPVKDDAMTFPMILGMFFLVLIIFMLVLEYMHFVTVFKQADDAVERSVIAVATQNWDNIYQGVREGFAGANTKEAITDEWTEVLKRDNIMVSAIDIMGLTLDSGNYVKKSADGKILYSIKPTTVHANIINVGIEESPGVTNVGSKKGLIVEVTYDISVAWFTPTAWGDALPITVTRTVRTQYKPLF